MMDLAELKRVANAMVAPGKGVLAADESAGTVKKRFEAIGVESTEENRRDYRELLFRSKGMANISGVILFDETIRQKAKDGTPLVKVIEQAGSFPGIKVDKGVKPLPFCPGEVVTEGLDGLRERLIEYRDLGAKFCKWRAVIEIGPGIPSYNCIKANVQALARYAALCQDETLVPIVEPEVLMDGSHSLAQCEAGTSRSGSPVTSDQTTSPRYALRSSPEKSIAADMAWAGEHSSGACVSMPGSIAS